MTQKERKLGMIAGGLFAVFLAYMIVQRLLIGPIVTLRNDITTMQRDRDQFEIQAQAEGTYRRLWTQLAARTLSSDTVAARSKLDQLIKDLLRESGLDHFNVNPGDLKPSKEKLYSVIPYTVVGAEGDMQAFVKFLHKFYLQPYAMQITGFNIEPATFRKGNTLRVSSLTIEALLLTTDGLPASLVSAAKPAATDPASRPTATNATLVANAPATAPATAIPGRPKEADLQAYAVLWDKKFMQPWEQPPPPPPPLPPPSSVVAMPSINPGSGLFTGPMDVRITCSTPGATIRYTTDGTDPNPSSGQVYANPVHLEAPGTVKAIACAADNRVSSVAVAAFSVPPPPPLKIVILDDCVREAVAMDEQSKQRQVVQEGDSLDGGKLILVLPYVAVVEMPNGARYVYRLGKGFRDKELLSEAQQPDVWDAVQKLVVADK